MAQKFINKLDLIGINWPESNNIMLEKAINEVSVFLNNHLISYNDNFETVNGNLWVYWNSGEEGAPDIVKSCLKTMRDRNQDRKVILINDNSIEQYVKIPNSVKEKLSNDKTHFSDILRVSLLAEHGGIWADATCFFYSSATAIINNMRLTDLDEQFTRSAFFAFTSGNFISSWFLISSKNNIITTCMRDFLFWYWTKNEELPHYFWFHYIFQGFYFLVPEFRSEWDRTIRKSSRKAHILQKLLGDQYNEKDYKETIKKSNIHKLTYKVPDHFRKNGTYFQKICSAVSE